MNEKNLLAAEKEYINFNNEFYSIPASNEELTLITHPACLPAGRRPLPY